MTHSRGLKGYQGIIPFRQLNNMNDFQTQHAIVEECIEFGRAGRTVRELYDRQKKLTEVLRNLCYALVETKHERGFATITLRATLSKPMSDGTLLVLAGDPPIRSNDRRYILYGKFRWIEDGRHTISGISGKCAADKEYKLYPDFSDKTHPLAKYWVELDDSATRQGGVLDVPVLKLPNDKETDCLAVVSILCSVPNVLKQEDVTQVEESIDEIRTILLQYSNGTGHGVYNGNGSQLKAPSTKTEMSLEHKSELIQHDAETPVETFEQEPVFHGTEFYDNDIDSVFATQNKIPLSPNKENAIREVSDRLWHNEQFSKKDSRTLSQALDLLEIWGEGGVPLEKLERLLYPDVENRTELVSEIIDTLNHEFAMLEREQDNPRFIIKVSSIDHNSLEKKVARLTVITSKV